MCGRPAASRGGEEYSHLRWAGCAKQPDRPLVDRDRSPGYRQQPVEQLVLQAVIGQRVEVVDRPLRLMGQCDHGHQSAPSIRACQQRGCRGLTRAGSCRDLWTRRRCHHGPVDSCVFCAILRGEASADLIAEEDHAVAFMDIRPATRGHLLVVPRRHAENLLDTPADDLTACTLLAQRMAHLVRERLGADGVNLMTSAGRAAWQTVFHLHVHVLPRYAGDPLRLPWTPTLGDPAEIAAACKQLRGE